MKTASLIAVLLAASPCAWAQKGHSADPREVCVNDIKDSEAVIKQGFFWVRDAATADRLTGLLMANLACEAKAGAKKAGSKGVCAVLEKMGPAYRYEKVIGTERVRCEWLSDYADFYWEMMTAPKTQKRFPACEAYLDRLDFPAKFFDIRAKAPVTGEEPGNDGGFWNVCRVISQKMQAGSTEMCEPRLKHYFGPTVPPETGFSFCRAAARLWAKGDPQFCDMLKPNNEKCLAEAAMTKAFNDKNTLLCPPTGPERGLCVEKLGPKGKPCVQTWQDLQGDFCSERASVSIDELKNMKKGPKQAPRTGEQGGGGR